MKKKRQKQTSCTSAQEKGRQDRQIDDDDATCELSSTGCFDGLLGRIPGQLHH